MENPTQTPSPNLPDLAMKISSMPPLQRCPNENLETNNPVSAFNSNHPNSAFLQKQPLSDNKNLLTQFQNRVENTNSKSTNHGPVHPVNSSSHEPVNASNHHLLHNSVSHLQHSPSPFDNNLIPPPPKLVERPPHQNLVMPTAIKPEKHKRQLIHGQNMGVRPNNPNLQE